MTDLPDEFLNDVKSALENLYDFPALNRHPLAAGSPAGGAAEAAGHRLRRELIEAIESLRQQANTTPGGRIYPLLNLHYVAAMPLPEAAASLGVSVRQAYRDLRQGHEAVGWLLWVRRHQAGQGADAPPDALTPTSLTAMIEAAVKAVSRLAEGHSVTVHADLPAAPLTILTDPAAAQQVCIHLLSQTVQAAASGTLTVMLSDAADGIALTLDYPARSPGAPVPIGSAVQGFIERLRLTLEQMSLPDGMARVCLRFSARRAALLVIDDHAGLTDLIQRYVADRALEVLAATDGVSGLALAREMQPSAVLLDLMMPGMDGWELLQRLRTTPETTHLPVIICSVINDPELAYSLGASYFLPKPITREALAAALGQVGV